METENEKRQAPTWHGLQYVLVAACMMISVGIVAHTSTQAINQRFHAVIHALKAR